MSFTIPLFVVSAPSGTGKTTIIKQARDMFPRLVPSVSHTTRSPREGERDGEDYFFVNREDFENMIASQEFLEWAEVHENYYGTSQKFLHHVHKDNNIVVLDIDVQGAMNLKNTSGLNAVFIFIVPPSMEELVKRLTERGTEEKKVIEKRITNAEYELTFQNRYDYVIINEDLDLAVKEFLNIIKKKTSVYKDDSY